MQIACFFASFFVLKGFAMFQVRQLLGLPSFLNSTVVAGHSGLNRDISEMSVMEVPDIESYIRPGSFLLSTLYPFYGNPNSLENLIPRLDTAKLSGIGIKLNRYVSDLPSVCLEQADSLGFPLVILPAGSDFSVQINEYLGVQIERNHEELEHRNFVHEKAMGILLQGGNSGDLARILSQTLHRTVVLMDQNFEHMADHHYSPWKFDMANLKAACRTGEFNSELADLSFTDGFALVYAVKRNNISIGYIAVCDRSPFEFSHTETITLQQFATVFRVIIQNNIIMEDQESRNRELFFCDLIYQNISKNEIARNRANLFNWKLSFPIAIFLLQISDISPAFRERQKLLRLMQKMIESEFFPNCPYKNTFWAEKGSSIAIILNETALSEGDRIAARITQILHDLSLGDVHLSQSRESAGLQDIPKAYREAQYALKIARQMKKHELMKFRDLGVYRIISSAQNQQDLRDFCMDTIGPLLDYDRRHSSDLIRTLETVIEQGNQLKAASEALFIHYNTIRYRYHLIEKIIGKDLNDPNNYQNISLALKIYRVLSAE